MSSEDLTTAQLQATDFDQNTFAAIDLGSNSFHLAIARLTNGTLQPLVKDKQLVRLAQGLNERRELSRAAMDRGLTVIRSFAKVVKDMDASRVRVVATYTLRRARNRNEFLRAAREIFPFPIEVISGDEEARLIYQGVAHTTHFEGKRLVVDIGGGSTEFAIGEHFDLLQLSSQPMGCISYTRRFFENGEITRKAFREAETHAQQRLELIDLRFRQTGWDAAIGSSGTARAILQYAQYHKLTETSDFNLELLKSIRKKLIDSGHPDFIEGIEEGRRPVLAGGLAVMIAVFKQLEIEQMSVSDAALREGVLYELTERMQHHDIRERTVNSLMVRYDIDAEQARRVKYTADRFFADCEEVFPITLAPEMQRILQWACLLHELGLHINRRGLQRHSQYIIENAELPGFSDEDQKLLALLVGSWRKNFSYRDFPDFNLYPPEAVFMLVAVLRLSTLLNLRRLENFLPDIIFSAERETIKLRFPDLWLSQHPLARADLYSEAAALKANHCDLELH